MDVEEGTEALPRGNWAPLVDVRSIGQGLWPSSDAAPSPWELSQGEGPGYLCLGPREEACICPLDKSPMLINHGMEERMRNKKLDLSFYFLKWG